MTPENRITLSPRSRRAEMNEFIETLAMCPVIEVLLRHPIVAVRPPMQYE